MDLLTGISRTSPSPICSIEKLLYCGFWSTVPYRAPIDEMLTSMGDRLDRETMAEGSQNCWRDGRVPVDDLIGHNHLIIDEPELIPTHPQYQAFFLATEVRMEIV